jgi:NAD(P)-dependent dehydrogenase (short-subunit alcohol dehydrogenase family)
VETFEGTVAVVTAAASGIGLALVEGLVASGAAVAMADIDGDRLAREAARLRAAGADVLDVSADAGAAADVDALAEQVMDRFGRVDLLCNNAGTIAFGAAWEIELADWERVVRVNLLSVVHGIRSFIPLMRAGRDDGHVVNTASMAAFMKLGTVAPYVATKHAVVGLSEALAEDLRNAGSGIGVSVVCPGMVATRFGQPDADIPPDEELPDGVVSAGVAAAAILTAIAERRFYVFTHDESIDVVQERHDRIVTSFS